MVYRLSILLTHATFINHNYVPLLGAVGLSMERIFSKALEQAKNDALEGTLVCQTLFQGKRKPTLQPMTL
jgi:hypothetical protein